MFNKLSKYIEKLLSPIEKPATYGSALEQFIVSHGPQTTADVEALIKRFDQKIAEKHLW